MKSGGDFWARDLAPRFGFTLAKRPLLALAAPDCHITLPPARLAPNQPIR